MANKYKVAVLPGDGIGPEVTDEAVKVLNATDVNFELLYCDIGGSAYLRNGDPLPPSPHPPEARQRRIRKRPPAQTVSLKRKRDASQREK
jgi:isocitrate/isopropylmalate dehydrogenase